SLRGPLDGHRPWEAPREAREGLHDHAGARERARRGPPLAPHDHRAERDGARLRVDAGARPDEGRPPPAPSAARRDPSGRRRRGPRRARLAPGAARHALPLRRLLQRGAMGDRLAVGVETNCTAPLRLERTTMRLMHLLRVDSLFLPDHYLSFVPRSVW